MTPELVLPPGKEAGLSYSFTSIGQFPGGWPGWCGGLWPLTALLGMSTVAKSEVLLFGAQGAPTGNL